MSTQTIAPIKAMKSSMVGTWVSLAPELRPSKNPDGTIKAFYLSRTFVYRADDTFSLTVTNFADGQNFSECDLVYVKHGLLFWALETSTVVASTRKRIGRRTSRFPWIASCDGPYADRCVIPA